MHAADSPGRRGRARLVALAIAGALLPAACGILDNSDDPDDPGLTHTATADPEPDGPEDPAFPMPDTAVGRQAQWIVDQVNGEPNLPPDEVAERLAPELDVNVAELFDNARRAGPLRPVDLDVVGTEAVLRLRPSPETSPAGAATSPSESATSSSHGSSEPGDWRAVFSLDDADRINDISLDVDSGFPDPSTWAELLELLTTYDAEVSLYAAQVTEDQCEPIAAVENERQLPMASTFKLWVLESVARAVEDGSLDWSQRLSVDDEVRSLPSGQLQEEPNGHQESLSQTAAGMIAISDNTAADMLMRAVGRDTVEQTIRDTGHSAPELITPLLTTREFFTIGWSPDGDLMDAWRDAGDDVEARRAVLDNVPAGPLTVTAEDVDDPVWQDGLGWFANAEDICGILATLHDRPADDPDADMLRTILGHHRGVEIDEATWPYVAFKGGTARGVLAASWYGERSDGEAFVVSIRAAAESSADVRARTRFYDVGRYAFELLAR